MNGGGGKVGDNGPSVLIGVLDCYFTLSMVSLVTLTSNTLISLLSLFSSLSRKLMGAALSTVVRAPSLPRSHSRSYYSGS